MHDLVDSPNKHEVFFQKKFIAKKITWFNNLLIKYSP